jgi:hypothetical protein
MDIGEQRRTIYIEPIEEPSPVEDPAWLPGDVRPLEAPELEPAR